MDKISIIIPAYNVEKYIDKCIESIVNQSYHNWEIIIVVDGANDRTESVAKGWASKFENIIVITQENQGAGVARNSGLSMSSGEYIMFVDPDDWIEKNMLLEFIENKEDENGDFDLLISDCVCDYYDKDKYLYSIQEAQNEMKSRLKEDILMKYLPLFEQGLIRAPWCKLYKREIIEKNKIEFPPFRRSQDIVFNYRYYEHISSVKVFDSHNYHYRCSVNQNEKKGVSDYYLIVSTIYSEVMQMLDRWKIEPDRTSYKYFCDYLYNAFVSQTRYNESIEALSDIVSNQEIRMITKNAKGNSWKRRIIRILIITKMKGILKILTKLSQQKAGRRHETSTKQKYS